MIYFIAFFTALFLLLALAYKWELEMKLVIPWSILMGILSAITTVLLNNSFFSLPPLASVAVATGQALFFSAIAVMFLFFRDPERTPPVEDGIIVSPADGVIKYVKEIHNGEFPFALKGKRTISLAEFTEKEIVKDSGIQIGIGLSLLDVHVNRSPIDGKVAFLKKIPGSFKSLKQISSLLENERAVAIVEGNQVTIGLVLIASRLVRRISMYIQEGADTFIGQRIGMIRFGSQADVLIPMNKGLKVSVKEGDKVKAGISVLAVQK